MVLVVYTWEFQNAWRAVECAVFKSQLGSGTAVKRQSVCRILGEKIDGEIRHREFLAVVVGVVEVFKNISDNESGYGYFVFLNLVFLAGCHFHGLIHVYINNFAVGFMDSCAECRFDV